SLAVYVLSGFQRRNASEEAGMKYFLLGSLASAILIYGIATVFGATGSFNLANIRAAIGSEGFSNLPLAGLGSLLILAGFAFKVSWAPLHQWTPDVYSGAPTLVTQYMSVGIKAAAFAGLLRAFGVAFPELTAWTLPTQVLIAVTMLVGNLAALRQQSLKRMLAYSSVAQAGYIGLAVLANPAQGWPAALYYLAAYTLMNAGAFAVLYLLSRSEAGPTIDSLAGLGARQPWLAAALAVFMLSLAGIPPLAGFMGKYLVLAAAAREGYYGLVVLAAITSAMSLYYYLRPVAVAFFRNSDHAITVRRGTGSRIVVALGVAGVLVLGVLPNLAYSPMSGVAASAVPQENR
ncbi:MAG TPA: NADH-quinone oxidoreductase subunit N, partial [Deinococcales bacterium]|nr:NADH-quinone oxidoreductase subunit N [Deinococcales bacterium]